MSITRINEFMAQAGKEDDLKALLASMLPIITSAEGCESCQLLQKTDDSAAFVVLEVWTSTDAHAASAANIPKSSIHAAMALLAGPPKGAFYQ